MSNESQSSRSPLVGTVVGRYLLERLVGEGGMGNVFAARHQDLGRRAAVKILHERYNQSEPARQRFLREGQLACRISHPNIVDLYDIGIEAGRAYLVMQLLEGESLRSLIAREAPLSAMKTADLLVPVVSALAAAHYAGIVHRDLKPDNIFIALERNTAVPKILDFGISKVLDPASGAPLTETGAFLGTPYYMSPEQALGSKDVDARSDQYAVGVILYECVTGRRPVEDPSVYRIMQRIVVGDFASPRQHNPSLERQFEALILRAMARDPALRFPSLREVGRALLPYASERVRANYAGEVSGDALLQVRPPVSNDSQQDPELHTTLGESIHERNLPRAQARRPPKRALIAFALVFVLVSAMAWLNSRTSRPLQSATAASSASAFAGAGQDGAVGRGYRIRDLPIPDSRIPAAREAYQRGIEAYARSSYNEVPWFKQALELDPSMTAALVRILVPATWGWVMPESRELYDRAAAGVANLSERDRDLLHALEPFYRAQPADRGALRQRLEALLQRYPGDAEISVLRALNYSYVQPPEEIIGAFERAQAADDSYPDSFAWALEVCGNLGNTECVHKMEDVCRERFPTSATCLWNRSEWPEQMGECGEMERLARSLIATDPQSQHSYMRLAVALASLSKPAAAVEQVLNERWQHLNSSRRPEYELMDRASLAALEGDFEQVRGYASKLSAVVAPLGDANAHGPAAYFRIHAERESGRPQEAVSAAKSFLDQRDGWDPQPNADESALAVDETPLALRVLGESERITKGELERQRAEWTEDWARRGQFHRSFLWLYGWASTVMDAEGARRALVQREQYLPLTPFRPGSITEFYEGLTYFHAGRIDEAIERLSASTKTCRALLFPFEHTQAHDYLGRALELRGDVTEACRAYAVVVQRWGRAKPRSVTAAHAKSRLLALHCTAN